MPIRKGALVHHTRDDQYARVLKLGKLGDEPAALLQWLDDNDVPTGQQTWAATKHLDAGEDFAGPEGAEGEYNDWLDERVRSR